MQGASDKAQAEDVSGANAPGAANRGERHGDPYGVAGEFRSGNRSPRRRPLMSRPAWQFGSLRARCQEPWRCTWISLQKVQQPVGDLEVAAWICGVDAVRTQILATPIGAVLPCKQSVGPVVVPPT